MSENESEFVKEMYEILSKVRKYHLNTRWVVGVSSGIVIAFGVLVIGQGYTNSRESAKAITNTENLAKEIKMISETQTKTYELNQWQFGVMGEKADADKLELQRQLDLIMKDRKLVERGSSR